MYLTLPLLIRINCFEIYIQQYIKVVINFFMIQKKWISAIHSKTGIIIMYKIDLKRTYLLSIVTVSSMKLEFIYI